MSTQIYNTCKIPTSDMKAMVRIAREMQRIEIPALIRSFGAKYSLLVPDSIRQAVRGMQENKEYGKLRNLERAVRRFCALTKANPTIVTDPEDAKYFCDRMKDVFPDEITDFSSIIDMIEEVARLREVTFIPTKHGFTLMKWYNLTEHTRHWVESQFEDFDYQNSTDGPPLKELEPEIDREIDERTEDFINDALGYNFAEVDPEVAVKLVNAVKDCIKDSVAYTAYKERDKVWMEAVGYVNSYAESGLTYDMFSGWEREASRVCYSTFLTACKPAEEQDRAELKAALAWKEKEDAWRKRVEERAKKDTSES